MGKILFCVLLATEWAFAFEIPDLSVNFQASSLPRQTSKIPTRGDLMLETPATATMYSSLSKLTKRVNKLEKDREDEKSKDKRVNDFEKKFAKMASELRVDCGSPTTAEGTDIVYNSTGLHAIANYRCKKDFLSIYPGQQMMSLCQKDGHWSMVNVKCVNSSGCWTAPAGKALYTGTRSTTITGKVCQRWDSQIPQTHEYHEDAQFSIPGYDTLQTVTGSANYCRDPSRDGYIWCYTTDRNTRWDRCDVPRCEIQN